jgi:hypothetical protein
VKTGLPSAQHLPAALYALADDPDATVRLQLALSLGECDDSRAGTTLGRLACSSLQNQWVRAAVLSSATKYCDAVLSAVLTLPEASPGREDMIRHLVATAAASSDEKVFSHVFNAILPAKDPTVSPWQMAALAPSSTRWTQAIGSAAYLLRTPNSPMRPANRSCFSGLPVR